MKRHELVSLRSEIRRLAAEGSAVRPRIHESHGPARDAWWQTKRAVGRLARAHYLAYALLRGVPYALLEPRAVPGERPSSNAVAAVVERHAPALLAAWTPHAIRAWMQVPSASPVPRATPVPVVEDRAEAVAL